MDIKSLDIAGLADINDNAAESLTGGMFSVIFISQSGERTVQRIDSTDSGVLDIPDDFQRIRVRNRTGSESDFILDFSSDRAVGIGEFANVESRRGSTVLRRGDTVVGRTEGGSDTRFSPMQVRVQAF